MGPQNPILRVSAGSKVSDAREAIPTLQQSIEAGLWSANPWTPVLVPVP